tara:strand:+ start:344 stop:583 length:240 start_codon:yes stop_codon:yes gene_type:complete
MIENKVKIELKKILPRSKFNQKKKLISEGILDSFNILILITNLERIFKIKINLKKLNIKNFETVQSISKLVKKIKKNDR